MQFLKAKYTLNWFEYVLFVIGEGGNKQGERFKTRAFFLSPNVSHTIALIVLQPPSRHDSDAPKDATDWMHFSRFSFPHVLTFSVV